MHKVIQIDGHIFDVNGEITQKQAELFLDELLLWLENQSLHFAGACGVVDADMEEEHEHGST